MFRDIHSEADGVCGRDLRTKDSSAPSELTLKTVMESNKPSLKLRCLFLSVRGTNCEACHPGQNPGAFYMLSCICKQESTTLN